MLRFLSNLFKILLRVLGSPKAFLAYGILAFHRILTTSRECRPNSDDTKNRPHNWTIVFLLPLPPIHSTSDYHYKYRLNALAM